MADGEDLGGGDGAEGLAALWVAEDDDWDVVLALALRVCEWGGWEAYRLRPWRRWRSRCGPRRCARAARPGCSRRGRSWCWGSGWRSGDRGVSFHCRIPDLSGTYAADEVGHRGAACRITTGQEATDAGGVRNALDGELAGAADTAGDLVEEQRANGGGVANVACLRGAAGVDDADRAAGGAVGELVVRAAAVLALGDGVLLERNTTGGFRDGEGLWVGDGGRGGGCESTAHESEGEEGELHVGKRVWLAGWAV